MAAPIDINATQLRLVYFILNLFIKKDNTFIFRENKYRQIEEEILVRITFNVNINTDVVFDVAHH
jgi:hypothetical protein